MVHFREELSGAVWLSELELIIEIDSGLQNIRYYRSREYGRVLIIDDEIQHVEAWAPFYHELIVHLPCGFITSPTSALVLGGGSLFAAEELLKYDSIKSIDLVDHDMSVIRATTKAYPERCNIVTDERLQIIEQKYQNYLPICQKRYDVIINDCFDLYSADTISSIDYYKIIEGLLKEEGICSDLIYRSIYNDKITSKALQRISKHLNKAASMVAIPEYPGVFHILTMWGNNKSLSQNQIKLNNHHQSAMCENGQFLIYNPKFLAFYLYVPPYIAKYVR